MKDTNDAIVTGILGAAALFILYLMFEPYLYWLFVVIAIGAAGVGGFLAWRIYERSQGRSKKLSRETKDAPSPPAGFDYQTHAEWRESVKHPETKAMKPAEGSRLEHTLIVTRAGHGKTQLLEWQILHDLRLKHPPGMVIIDSKSPHPEYRHSNLIDRISRLKIFNPDDGRLKDKLIIVDPLDRPALSLFDVPIAQQQEAADELGYFLEVLLDDGTSASMKSAYYSLVKLMLHITESNRNEPDKGANFDMLSDAIDEIGKFNNYIKTMPEDVDTARTKKYLFNEFPKKGHIPTNSKQAARRRIASLMERSSLFTAMFNATQNKLNLVDALDNGKIVLVSADEAPKVLGDFSPIFGRAIIARVVAATLNRNTRRPAYLIVDEALPYTKDHKIRQLLAKTRSFRVGTTLAYQTFPDVPQSLRSTIMTNTCIKYVGADDETATWFASPMRTSKDFIMSHTIDSNLTPTFTRFAVFDTRTTQTAQTLTLPLGEMDKEERMSDEQYARLRAFNRANLGVI